MAGSRNSPSTPPNEDLLAQLRSHTSVQTGNPGFWPRQNDVQLLTMYLFTCLYNAPKNMPNFASRELAGIPAPESKTLLWEASDRASWVAEYNRHLATADEFGMMLLAVMSYLHGC